MFNNHTGSVLSCCDRCVIVSWSRGCDHERLPAGEAGRGGSEEADADLADDVDEISPLERQLVRLVGRAVP